LSFNTIDIGNIIDWSRESHISKYMEMKEGECFIDAGAHIGLWTMYIGRNGYRVYAFEPNPEIYEILVENTSKYPKVIRILAGLGDIKTVKSLYLHKRSVLNSLRTQSNEFTGRSIKVSIVPLDEFNFRNVGIIKMDTEGYESNILKGAIETILRYKPRLIIEVHQGLRALREELEILTNILIEYGYKWKAEYKRDSGQPILIADST